MPMAIATAKMFGFGAIQPNWDAGLEIKVEDGRLSYQRGDGPLALQSHPLDSLQWLALSTRSAEAAPAVARSPKVRNFNIVLVVLFRV